LTQLSGYSSALHANTRFLETGRCGRWTSCPRWIRTQRGHKVHIRPLGDRFAAPAAPPNMNIMSPRSKAATMPSALAR